MAYSYSEYTEDDVDYYADAEDEDYWDEYDRYREEQKEEETKVEPTINRSTTLNIQINQPPTVDINQEQVCVVALNVLADSAAANSAAHGFHENWNDAEKIALMHSELSEALENIREGGIESDKIAGFSGVEEELADTIIRICDYAGYYKLRLGEAVLAKMRYNSARPYKHGKKF